MVITMDSRYMNMIASYIIHATRQILAWLGQTYSTPLDQQRYRLEAQLKY